MTDQDVDKFLAIRKEAAQYIDPETAEVDWIYGQIMDSYGTDPDLPDELRCIGRIYFARSPGSDIWVCFHDLPEEVRDALWEKHSRNLAFPAGLSLAPDEEKKLRLRSDGTQ